ncbi:hypothetical protein BDK51DRAFT_50832, partial [Blyttiomyces helicus]
MSPPASLFFNELKEGLSDLDPALCEEEVVGSEKARAMQNKARVDGEGHLSYLQADHATWSGAQGFGSRRERGWRVDRVASDFGPGQVWPLPTVIHLNQLPTSGSHKLLTMMNRLTALARSSTDSLRRSDSEANLPNAAVDIEDLNDFEHLPQPHDSPILFAPSSSSSSFYPTSAAATASAMATLSALSPAGSSSRSAHPARLPTTPLPTIEDDVPPPRASLGSRLRISMDSDSSDSSDDETEGTVVGGGDEEEVEPTTDEDEGGADRATLNSPGDLPENFNIETFV